ncbi:hypothetical protein [Roseibium marinum]|uniref:Uncharacterized protein n=1 Tax=Roseibium marinum TaxID=281252 RepID=A0A2S3UNL6_9HYPH|nr:hypothetical protein [Roseibium marinum]POF29089.1 hypothetical protein CLV41_11093 [Roseibium marinum]
MPISLDEGFAGALGVEFGAGAQMADQLDRLGRALERRRDPLTRIGLDTYEAIREMAAALQAPPIFVTPVRVVNLGFLELMAGGTFVFAILIYLKLDQIWRSLGAVNVKLNQIGSYLSIQTSALLALMGDVAGLLRFASVITGYLSLISQILLAILGAIKLLIGATWRLSVEYVFDIGPNLRSIDLGDLILDLAALVGLMTAMAVLGGPAGAALLIFGIGALVAALGIHALAAALKELPEMSELAKLAGLLVLLSIFGGPAGVALLVLGVGALVAALGIAALAGALHLMPEGAADLMMWAAILVAVVAAVLLAFALLLTRGKAIVGVIVGVAASLVLLYGIAGALQLMPDNTGELVKSLILLGVGLVLLMHFFKNLKGDDLQNIALGLLALAGFLLLTAAAFRIFDETAIQAMEKMPALFEALNALAENIVAQQSNFETIAKGLIGIVLFVGLLGLALRLFPDDAAPAMEAMAQVFQQLTAIADKIVELADSGKLETVAAGLLGIVIFIGLLGLVLMLFDEQSIQAAFAIAAVAQSFASLATALASIDPANFWTIVGLLAALAATTLAVGLAAQIGGPHLSALAEVLRAMADLLNTVASNASRLAEALRNLPSISLPSLPSLPSISLPGMATGGPVNSTGPYMLHEGEYVLNPGQTRAMAEGGGVAGAPRADNSVSVGAVNITVSAQSVDEGSVPALGDEIVRQIASRLAELSRDDAFAQGVRAEAG